MGSLWRVSLASGKVTAVALTPRTPTPRTKCSTPPTRRSAASSHSVQSTMATNTFTDSITKLRCGRADESDPFHTEVGYWLWDGATGEIVRGFVVPRGITVLAGGVRGR